MKQNWIPASANGRHVRMLTRFLAGITFVFVIASFCIAAPHAFPVPYVESRGDLFINFTELPAEGTIKIYTITGEEVLSITIAPGQITYPWPVTNADGKKLITGVYLFIIEGSGQRTDGKIVVIR
jgi:hypothetical protein